MGLIRKIKPRKKAEKKREVKLLISLDDFKKKKIEGVKTDSSIGKPGTQWQPNVVP